MHAQVFNPSVKLATNFSGTDGGMIMAFEFNGDFVINDHLSLGPGIGIGAAGFINENGYRNKADMVSTIPVFANAKWFFMPKRKVSPFVYAQAGYTFCFNDYYDLSDDFEEGEYDEDFIEDTGMNLSFGPGIDIAFRKGSLHIMLNWSMQRVKFYEHDYYHTVSETLFGVSLGYSWGTRR